MTLPHGNPAWLAGTIVYTAAFYFAIEFVLRGYLITRLIELTGRAWLAILVSSALVSLPYVDHGMWEVLPTFLASLVYARFYRFSGSIWPAVLAHWLLYVLLSL